MIEGGGLSSVGIGDTLFGRTTELARIDSALDATVSGHGELVCLVGEPGIGKTRLAVELTRLANERGCSTHWGRTWEGGGAPPMWPWTQVLQSLLRTFPTLQTLAAQRPLVALFGSPDQSVAATSAPLPDSEAERFAWMVSLTEFLDAGSQLAPLLLLFEDVHAADLATLRLLRFASQELRGKRLLVAMTYRNVEARLRDDAAELLAHIERAGTVVHLSRLDRPVVNTWLRRHFGASDVGLEENIFSATMGNPLFVDEVLRLLSSQGDRALGSGQMPIPYGIRQIIRQRLAGLSASARELLELAAVAGTDVDLDLMRKVARDSAFAHRDGSVFVLDDALREAEQHDILLPAGRHIRRFSHALIQEVLVRDLTASRRAELHLLLAKALETFTEPPVEEIAHHYLQAEGFVSEIEPLVTWTLRASEHRQQLLAHEDAITLLEHARKIIERLNAPKQLGEILLALAAAWTRTGDIARARPICLTVVEIARRESDGVLLARAALGYGAEFDIGFVDTTLVALLEDALARLPESEVGLRARSLARLAAALQPSEDPSAPMAMARDAIALARTTNDDDVLLSVLHNAMASMMDFADARERLALNREQLDLSRARGDRARELRAHLRLMLDSLELGEWSALKGHANAFEALVRSLRQDRLLPIALVNQSLVAAAVGDFERSRVLTAEASARYDPSDMMRRWLPLHRIAVEVTAERWDELQSFDDELVHEWGHDPLWQLFNPPRRGMIAARAERREEAAYWLSQIPPIPVVLDDMTGSAFVMECAAYVGAAEQCRALRDRFMCRRGYLVSWGMQGQFCGGPVDRLLALLSASIEDWTAAEELFASAEQQTTALGMRPFTARIRYERARERLRRGRDEDQRVALADLAAAREIAEAVQLPGLLLHIERCASGARPSNPPSEPSRALQPATKSRADAVPIEVGFALTRQGEFWKVRYQGTEHLLKDSRGLQLLARLVETPGKELHALDLGASEGADTAAIDRGDAGPMLDERARIEYRRRLVELEETIEEAEAMSDIGRAERAREEREFLAQELSRAVGLGGRDRKTGAAAERARVAVTRRLRDAIQRIAQQCPPLGRHLERAVRTGTYCMYDPE